LEALIHCPSFLTEEQWQLIQHDAAATIGAKKIGEFAGKGTYAHLYKLADDIANVIMTFRTPDVVLDTVVPRLVEHFRHRNWPEMPEWECKRAIAPCIQKWHGIVGRRRIEAQQQLTQPPSRKPSRQRIPALKTRLASLRRQSNITVEKLAEAIGIETRSVYRHLSGTTPRGGHLEKYERFFTAKLGHPISLKEAPSKRQ
jgi:hypothetical protein